MRLIAIVLAAASVSGCTQTADIMARSPDARIESPQSPEVVARCLAKQNSLRVEDGDNGDLLVQMKNMYGALIYSFAIRPNGTGSTIEMRRGNAGMGFKYRDCLQSNWTELP